MTTLSPPKVSMTIALGATLLLYALLLTLPRPRMVLPKKQTPEAPLTPPQTAFLPNPAPPNTSNSRLLSSPVLFALPTPVGFSSALLDINLHARLTFPQLHELNNFLQPSQLTPCTIHSQEITPLKTLPSNPISPIPPAPRLQANTPKPATIHLSPTLQKRLQSPLSSLPKTQTPHFLQATLVVDPRGSVQHIFIENPDANATPPLKWLRYLRQISFAPAPETTYGTIEINPQPTGDMP